MTTTPNPVPATTTIISEELYMDTLKSLGGIATDNTVIAVATATLAADAAWFVKEEARTALYAAYYAAEYEVCKATYDAAYEVYGAAYEAWEAAFYEAKLQR